MANVIIGTAGHIDHGKTTLIKALTGIETDRLKEEKKRGITIELGFAYFDLPSERRAGIVDVPGHEKFIKNMLAGISGIDLVLFIVAADEGIMPQTVEHLDILNILGVEQGIIVITKKDIVDSEMLELVEEEILETVQGTILENSEIISVSSTTGENLNELIQMIDLKTNEIKMHNQEAPFRMNIDRVFTLKGYGTVATGTLLEGKIQVNDEIEIYPLGIKTKARSIQVHGHASEVAYAGQRTAVNLPGVKVEDIHRGNILSLPGSLTETSIIDIKLKLLEHSKRILKHGSRVRFYHGTQELMGRLILFNQEEILPGDEVFSQLRFSKPMACKYGDKFVIRFYSPMETIGGGIIIDPKANKHRRYQQAVIEEMIIKEQGSLEQLVETFILSENNYAVNLKSIIMQFGESEDKIFEIIQILIDEEVIIELTKDNYVHREKLGQAGESVFQLLNQYHQTYPLVRGLNKEEIKSRLFKNETKAIFEMTLKYLFDQHDIKEENGKIALDGFEIVLNQKQQERIKRIETVFKDGGYKPPTYKSLDNTFSKEDYILMNLLIDEGVLIKINQDIIFEKNNYLSIKRVIIKYIEENGTLAVSDMKELIDTSRKYTVPLLEHFDQIKLTKRIDNHRVLL